MTHSYYHDYTYIIVPSGILTEEMVAASCETSLETVRVSCTEPYENLIRFYNPIPSGLEEYEQYTHDEWMSIHAANVSHWNGSGVP